VGILRFLRDVDDVFQFFLHESWIVAEVEVVSEGCGRPQSPRPSQLLVADQVHLFQLLDVLVGELSTDRYDT